MTTEEAVSPIVAGFEAGSPRREAVDFACVAAKITGAPLVFLTVRRAGEVADIAGGAKNDARSDEAQAVEHLRAELRQRGIRTPDVRVVSGRRVGARLVEALKELRPSLVVLGSPAHKGAGHALLGDVVEAVISETTCPVALVPHGHHAEVGEVRVVGVAFAPTDEGRVALRTGATLAQAASASLRVIEAKRDASGPSDELREALATFDVADADERAVDGDPVSALVAASQELDMLVLGSRAHGPRRALVLGSVSRKVAEQAACPTLIVPRAASGAAGALLAHAQPHVTT